MPSRAESSQPREDDERYDVREERRSRKQLSCAECHRLKLKCDRQVPCNQCIRRECTDLCPNSVRIKKAAARPDGDVVGELRDRLATIEGLLTQIPGLQRPRSRSRSGSGVSSSREQPYHHNGHRSHHRHDEHRIREDERRRSRSPRDHVSSHELGRAGPSRYVADRSPNMYQSDMQHRDYGSSRSRHDLRGESTRRRIPDSPPSRRFSTFEYNTERQADLQRQEDESYGTLVIDRSGRSKWLGPTAGTEWLKNQEISETNTPRRSRSPELSSPEQPRDYGFGEENLFPFPSWGPPPSIDTITLHLPRLQEASVLMDAYYDNYTWNHDVAPRRFVQPIFDRAYALDSEKRVHPQQLGLLFIILAMGALFNPALPPHDPSAEHHLAAARWCLVRGDFIGNNTIAGLQCVVIMAHYHLETEKGRNGDSAWPLWGVAMRLVTAMGMHIDGKRWNLPDEVAEERRLVFWETQTIDVFQANCFSRPNALRPEHIDTAFPSDHGSSKSFRTLKFEMGRISGAVLDQAMDVRPTSYASIENLYDRLCAFERHIPFHLRCRTALLSLPSVYADADSATRDSPAITNNLHLTFQQFTLALNVSETILFLQRPYFVRALQEAPHDPTTSRYGKSYLAVVERCNVLIEVVGGLYDLYPTVTARHWFFWYHLFTAAVCIGTLIIINPVNPLSGLVMGLLDQSLRLYSSVQRDHATPSLQQNHQWLLRLRARAMSKLSNLEQVPHDAEADAEVDVELLGWRTRLIERARGSQRATTIPRPPSPGLMQLPTGRTPAPSVDQVLQQHFANVQGPVPAPGVDMSTDLFLHQFWDPMTLLESREGNAGSTANSNWWSNFGIDEFIPDMPVR